MRRPPRQHVPRHLVLLVLNGTVAAVLALASAAASFGFEAHGAAPVPAVSRVDQAPPAL